MLVEVYGLAIFVGFMALMALIGYGLERMEERAWDKKMEARKRDLS